MHWVNSMQNYFPCKTEGWPCPGPLFYFSSQKANLKFDLINNTSGQWAQHLWVNATLWYPKSPGTKEATSLPFIPRELFIAQHANENPSDPGKLLCLSGWIIIQDQLQDAHVCFQTHSLSSLSEFHSHSVWKNSMLYIYSGLHITGHCRITEVLRIPSGKFWTKCR